MWKPKLPPFRKFKKSVFLQHAQTSQFIHQLGELNTIRSTSKKIPVKDITSEDMRQKIAYLKKCMMKYRRITGVGRGIAAVQVGIPECFAVIYIPDKKEKLMTIINPVVIKRSKKKLRFPEGCMSEGPLFAPVVRPSWIEFEYYDEQGKKHYWDTKDEDPKRILYNRVFQHEIDHMDGIIFLDKANLKELVLESDPTYYDKASFEEV